MYTCARRLTQLFETVDSVLFNSIEHVEAGPGPGEMAVVADQFQASGLYAHCVVQFVGGLQVSSVVVRLLQARDSGLAELEEVAMGYLKANVMAFQVRLFARLESHTERCIICL